MGHTSFQLNRRSFLRAGLSTAGAMALGPAFFERAFAAGPVQVGPGPYGPLQPFDSNGIALPAGFTSREIARGASPVAGSTPPYVWHPATDGQATFPTLTDGKPDGGWILVANSEMPVPATGGVSGVEFDSDGTVERAYRVLAGTTSNCAGGPTPWGTWLSCEEYDQGFVHECDPTTLNVGVARPAMGAFAHEAVCVDPVARRLYLTEDEGDGCLYRFTPDDYPDLSNGLLEVAVGTAGPGTLSWVEVPNPLGGALQPTRAQVAEAAHFDGGEGTWFDDGIVYFTTKGDGRVWTYNVATQMLDVLYDEAAVGPDAPLSGVDNITVSPSGDIFVCEDGRDHDICMVTPEFEVTRFLKLDPVMHAGSPDPNPLQGNETVGVIFSPDGNRMYFGAQRSFPIAEQLPAGVVYEISGPFRKPAPAGGAGGGSDAGLPGSIRLRARKRRRIAKLLSSGFPISLESDAPVGVKATLRVASVGGDGLKRSRMVARAATSVAVSGAFALKLKPTRAGARLLDGRDEMTAELKVTAIDGSGKQTVLRRNVRLIGGEG
jgi:uncharacterized protein